MSSAEVIKIREILVRIKDTDGHVKQAIAICDKQLASYDSRQGQLREQYDYDNPFR